MRLSGTQTVDGEDGEIDAEMTEHYGDCVRVDVVDPRKSLFLDVPSVAGTEKERSVPRFPGKLGEGLLLAVIVDAGKVPAALSVIKAVDRALADRKGRDG